MIDRSMPPLCRALGQDIPLLYPRGVGEIHDIGVKKLILAVIMIQLLLEGSRTLRKLWQQLCQRYSLHLPDPATILSELLAGRYLHRKVLT